MARIGIVSGDDFKIADNLPYLIEFARKEFNSEVIIINPDIENSEELLKSIDVFYPRILPISDHSLLNRRVDYYFQLVKNYNTPHTIDPELYKKEFNKYEQVRMVSEKGFLTPKTYLADNADEAKQISHKIGFPLVVKEIYGYGGRGVHLARDEEELEKLILDGKSYLLQEYISLDRAIDFRVYIVGGKVLGGIKRVNEKNGEFRSNTNQGATASFFVPSEELGTLALKIAESIGNKMVSVDFIKKDNKYYFIELNNSFSVKPDTEPKKIIIAREVIKFCISLAEKKKI